MADENDRLTNSFEKASQEYFKETWEFSWNIIGLIVLITLVGFGIYFSQIAISDKIGSAGLTLYFTWACAIAISPLEVAGVKLLGNKSRSNSIKESNKLEYNIASLFTKGLFAFDTITNVSGLFITALVYLQKTDPNAKNIDFWAWILIVFFGFLMAISEILVGWMFRSLATSYVAFIKAKQKYDVFKVALEREISDGQRSTSNQSSANGYTQRNQPSNVGNNSFNRNSSNRTGVQNKSTTRESTYKPIGSKHSQQSEFNDDYNSDYNSDYNA